MLTQADIQQLKDYVAQDDGGMQAQAESTVRLHASHSNLKANFMEIRLDRHMTIGNVKLKLSSHCGTNANDMQLSLRDQQNNLRATLSNDSSMLGYYSPMDGWRLHIQDTNVHSISANGWLEDTSKVAKYVMSDTEYDKREGTYRAHKLKMQQQDPEWTAEKELCMRRGVPYKPPQSKIDDDDYQAAEAEALLVGSRCEVDVGARRGQIRYIGRCEGLPKGFWVGVQYDEPVGKNNGSVKGKQYFDCEDGYGAFIRPAIVKQGHFPVIDEFQFSSEDEI